jgi:glutathione reductase (NADPH)
MAARQKNITMKSRNLLPEAVTSDGLGVVSEPEVSWKDVLRAKDTFTSKIPENTIANLKGNGVSYLRGEASFVDGNRVRVGDTIFKPRFVVIATGAEPIPLPFKGAEYLTSSDEFLDLEEIPRRVVLVGGGFISFEFAHFAARLGAVEVTIVEAMDRPLGPFDAEMVTQLQIASEADGIRVRTATLIESVSKDERGLTVQFSSGEQLEADLVVHGAGRRANVHSLNLESAGINVNGRGIEVDGWMQSSNSRVYAVGDCAATPQLARVADREAHIAASSIASRETAEETKEIDYSAVPAVLFSYPQLGMVGKTEEQLVSENIQFWKSSDKDLSWPTYRRIGMKHAAYKILVDADNRILGAHILADNVTGMLNTFKQAIIDGTTAEELYQDSIMSPYPSRESDIIYMLEPLVS